MKSPRFEFYEIVTIHSEEEVHRSVNGKLAAILGRSQSNDGDWSYAVLVYDAPGEVWSFHEERLNSTGERDSRETFYDGESIRVSANGKIIKHGKH